MLSSGDRRPAPGLATLYGSLSGSNVYVDELPGGNNGDHLIVLGSRHFREEIPFNYVDAPGDAEVIIIRGNGVLTDFYRATPHRARMQAYLDRFPDATVILEPSTLSIKAETIFEVGRRTAPFYIYARDARSYRNESQKAGYRGKAAYFGLGDDMAFSLRSSELIEDLARNRIPRHNLVVERYDIERPERSLRPKRLRAAITRAAPTIVKDAIRPHLAYRRSAASSGLKREAETILRKSLDSGLRPSFTATFPTPGYIRLMSSWKQSETHNACSSSGSMLGF